MKLFQLDFEKAYGNVKGSFLQQTLRMKGFSNEWQTLIQCFLLEVVWTPNSMITLADT
jgi:hypothetical protein